MSEFATIGAFPDPDACDECSEPTDSGSALCTKCAWNRYDAKLDDWNERLREDIAGWDEAS